MSSNAMSSNGSKMFARRSSQKPSLDMVSQFQSQFPHLGVVNGVPANVSVPPAMNGDFMASTQQRSDQEAPSHEVFHDQDPTPRASDSMWGKSTPSFQDQDLWTNTLNGHPLNWPNIPTPGSSNVMIHSQQAGDLATPNNFAFGMGGLGTPLSMPTAENAIQSGSVIQPGSNMMNVFQQYGFQSQADANQQSHFNNSSFAQQSPPQAFAPYLLHQDTGYETMEQDNPSLSPENRDMRPYDNFYPGQVHPGQMNPIAYKPSREQSLLSESEEMALPPGSEKLRFFTYLNVGTAMIKNSDEIPMTYLNKGQAYQLTIKDIGNVRGQASLRPGTRYRTFVRVSFEEEEQRQKPAFCWGLWKEGRGIKESSARGGKLQAVQYVEQQNGPRIEIESSSFDGFSVIWTPPTSSEPTNEIKCEFGVRFNFLSTDFSHSKGVKGIPLRLCVKTTIMEPQGSPPMSNTPPTSDAPTMSHVKEELCYCMIKLFRDHGAERKLLNDGNHVRKQIEKAEAQIAQAESGMKDVGKRKRGGGPKTSTLQGPGKAPKHKRTWSLSSTSTAGGANDGGDHRSPLEDDLSYRRQSLQDMFKSMRKLSVLYLRGRELDDPDLHPVSLPGGEGHGGRHDSTAPTAGPSSSLVSPSPSDQSIPSQQQGSINIGQPRPPMGIQPPPDAAQVQKSQVPKKDENGETIGFLDAIEVDADYQPPLERRPKPIACFYVALKNPETENTEIHRAMYLHTRSLTDMMDRICGKWSLDLGDVIRCVRILDNGLKVVVDDDVVREMPEGQDMVLEIVEVDRDEVLPKREWDMSLDHIDNDNTETNMPSNKGYELQLRF